MKSNQIVFGLLLFITGLSYSQQDSQFTQYMYNTVNVNPAYAGSRPSMSVFLLHRTQWLGFEGAPVTNAVAINTPIEETNLGLGISIVNDKIGPADENNVAVDLSYSINTSASYRLSFGLKVSANLLNIDFSKLTIRDKNDYLLDTAIDNKFSPNIGFGLYLHSNNTYLGVSIPSMLEITHFDRSANLNANSHVAKEVLNLYLIAGHVFDLSPEVKFKSSLLVKEVSGAPLQVDLSGNFMFNSKFVAGLAYRWNAAFSALVGFQTTDRWFIGYGYDLESTQLANYNSGTHELFLRYEFARNNRIISPRFF